MVSSGTGAGHLPVFFYFNLCVHVLSSVSVYVFFVKMVDIINCKKAIVHFEDVFSMDYHSTDVTKNVGCVIKCLKPSAVCKEL